MGFVRNAWDNEIEANVRRFHPGEDMATLRRQYEAQRDLELTRHDLEGTSEGVGEYLVRRSIPFASSLYNLADQNEYQSARQRVSDGSHLPGDLTRVARFEHQQQTDRYQGVGGQIVSGLAHVPSMIGEAYAGGAALRGLGIGATA